MKKFVISSMFLAAVISISVIKAFPNEVFKLNALGPQNYQDSSKLTKSIDTYIIQKGDWGLVVDKIRNQYPTLSYAKFIHSAKKATTELELNGKNYNQIRLITMKPETGDIILLQDIRIVDPVTNKIKKITSQIAYTIK